MPEFAHLHVHSYYSLLDGLVPTTQLVSECQALGMRSMAITDHGNMHGAIQFYKQMRAARLHPVIGVEVYCAVRTIQDKTPGVDSKSYHLTLLAQTMEGYRNLVALVTQANLDGFYYKPRIDLPMLERHSAGVVALSGCLGSQVSREFLDKGEERARSTIEWFRERFGRDRYYIELQDHGIPEQAKLNDFLRRAARDYGLRTAATNDVHYARKEDHGTHDVLLCVQTGKLVTDEKRMRMDPNAFYLKSPQEMEAVFPDDPEALETTAAIADSCRLDFRFGEVRLPACDLPEGETADSYLRRLCMERLPSRYPHAGPDVLRRLDYELDVLARTQISPYVLVVWDMVNWGREHGIHGEPRGSAAGSIVSYITGLSNVDPLAFDLPFERFLTTARAGVRAVISFPEYPIEQFLQHEEASA